jgi:hypothetical protein
VQESKEYCMHRFDGNGKVNETGKLSMAFPGVSV